MVAIVNRGGIDVDLGSGFTIWVALLELSVIENMTDK